MNRHRIDAIRENAEWLQEHSVRENKAEAIRRLGVMKNDVDSLIDTIAELQDES